MPPPPDLSPSTQSTAASAQSVQALAQQALAAHQQGDLSAALALYQQALARDPAHGQLHYLAGMACLALGLGDQAAAHFQAALRTSPDHVEALVQLGCLAMQAQQNAAAVSLFQRAVQRAPNDPRPFINLAGIALQSDDPQSAFGYAQQAVGLAPDHPDAWNNLGNAHHNVGRFAQAEQAFRRAVALAPSRAEFWQNLGDTQRAQDRLQSAAESYERALQLNPRHPPAWNNYGNLLGLMHRGAEAKQAFRRALEIDPRYVPALTSLAGHRIEDGDELAVIEELAPIVATDAPPPDLVAVYAYALRAAGRIGDAAQTLLRSIDIHATQRTLVYAFGQLALVERQHLPKAINLVEAWLEGQGPAAPQADRVVMRNLLANLLDKAGRHASAFAEATTAKALKGQRSDPAAEQALAAAIERHFTAARLTRAPYGMTPEHRPVLIVGMPRSGTSLLEQMLAGHPAVQACGEMPELELIAGELSPPDPTAWPERAAALDPSSLQALAMRYLHTLQPREGALRITDKMPHNFVNVGLFHLLFPQGRVIHIERDPRDVALSILFHDFAGHHPYANHIEDIAHHILFYRRCMAHWRANLPPGVLYDLRYEDLVAAPGAHARAVLQFLGLPWHDDVLTPEATARTVLTSSRFQVQEAIHRRAAGRWQPYARQLEPLTRLLRAHGALPN